LEAGHQLLSGDERIADAHPVATVEQCADPVADPLCLVVHEAIGQ
jgi:hypothetical protein